MLFTIVVIMSSILTQNNRERHHSQRSVARVLPFLLDVSTASAYWSDATNLASVSTEIRVLAPELDTDHDRRRVICWQPLKAVKSVES
ncbi:hypothetical protein HDV64DRAFT_245194 [Trichoderma sp. TUCIM 5745]